MVQSKNFSYLDQERVSSTIFITGVFAEVYPYVVRDWAYNPLFIIGDHSYSHPGFTKHGYSLTSVSSTIEKIDQIVHTQTILQKLIGYYPTLFRFPGLCHSVEDDRLVERLHLTVVDADDVSGDAFSKNKDDVVKQVLKQLGNNAVILFHTGGPHARVTFDGIKTLVPILKKQGFGFKSIETISFEKP